MQNPANGSEWITYLIGTFVAVMSSWPLLIFLMLWLYRSRLTDVAKWFGEQTKNRPFEASGGTHGLSVKVYSKEETSTEGVLASDVEAAIKLRKIPDAEPAALEIQRNLSDAQKALDRVDSIWSSETLNNSEARAIRIAERARGLLVEVEAEDADTIGYNYGLDDEDNPYGEALGTFVGPPASRALLGVRFSRPYSKGLENSDYVDWVRAAEILRDSGIDIPIPPFQPHHLRWAGMARSHGWIRRS